jgi:hypothetical protein
MESLDVNRSVSLLSYISMHAFKEFLFVLGVLGVVAAQPCVHDDDGSDLCLLQLNQRGVSEKEKSTVHLLDKIEKQSGREAEVGQVGPSQVNGQKSVLQIPTPYASNGGNMLMEGVMYYGEDWSQVDPSPLCYMSLQDTDITQEFRSQYSSTAQASYYISTNKPGKTVAELDNNVGGGRFEHYATNVPSVGHCFAQCRWYGDLPHFTYQPDGAICTCFSQRPSQSDFVSGVKGVVTHLDCVFNLVNTFEATLVIRQSNNR